MSFIYKDKNLIEQLLKAGIEFDLKFNKKAQSVANVTTNVELKNFLNLSDKLVDNLRSTVIPSKKDGTPDVSAGNNADMVITDMNSFGNFMQFIAQHKIVVDGQRVCYTGAEGQSLTIEQRRLWRPIAAERALPLETGDRQSVKTDYYVNNVLLTKYVNSLLSEVAANKDDPDKQTLVVTLLKAIIEKSNSILGTKMSSEYKDPTKTFDLDELLTTFPETLDSSMFATEGSKSLLWKDIQSSSAIKAWVNSNNISVKIPDREGGPLMVNHPEFDFCIVARVIYLKANFLRNNKAVTVELESKYDAMIKKITDTAAQLKGPNGESCSVASSYKPSSGRKVDKSNPDSDGELVSFRSDKGNKGSVDGSISEADAKALFYTMPLAMNDIDFSRIQIFLKKALPFVSGSDLMKISETNKSITRVSSDFMRNSDTIFPIKSFTSDPLKFLQNLKMANQMAEKCVEILQLIVSNVEDVLTSIKNKYSSQEDFSRHIGQLEGQLSIAQNNNADLEILKRSVIGQTRRA